MNRISEDVGKVRMYVGPAVMYSLNTLMRFTIVVIYMYNISPKLTLYSLLPLPLLSYSIFKISSMIHKKKWRVSKEFIYVIFIYSRNFLWNSRVIKAYAIENKNNKNLLI